MEKSNGSPLEVTTVRGAKIFLPEKEVENLVKEYLRNMDEHEGFRNELIRVMPDVHPETNSKTLVGFTMKFFGTVSPNIVGNDVGCGVSGLHVNKEFPLNKEEYEGFDSAVRDRIPMGKGVYNSSERNYYHVKDQFPWEKVNSILKDYIQRNNIQDTLLNEFLEEGGYNIQYFKNLCKRIGINIGRRGINGIGTLGGGNHFIEIGRGNDGFWILCHSGSRALGQAVSDYWQEKARIYRTAEQIRDAFPYKYKEYVEFDIESVSDRDLFEWVTGGKSGSFINHEKLRRQYNESNPEKIGEIDRCLKKCIPEGGTIDDPWSYLKEDEVYGYYRDMLFAQYYASENRRFMIYETARELGIEPEKYEFIDSPHNIVDLRDDVIRKGATNAQEGRRVIIPFNMRDGAIIGTGKGNEEWNNSVSHGAGRVRSRGDALDENTESDVVEQTKNIFSSKIPVDELPKEYKKTGLIKSRIKETISIDEEIKTIINFKADG